jgi:hypothetical protein
MIFLAPLLFVSGIGEARSAAGEAAAGVALEDKADAESAAKPTNP